MSDFEYHLFWVLWAASLVASLLWQMPEYSGPGGLAWVALVEAMLMVLGGRRKP
jgi:hypothetical protein